MLGDSAKRLAVGNASPGAELEPRAMLDAVEDAVFLCDPSDGSVLDSNRAGRQLLDGRSERADKASISDWSARTEGYDAARALEPLQRAASGHVERLAWRGQRADGSRFWAELRLVKADGRAEAPRVVAVLHGTSGPLTAQHTSQDLNDPSRTRADLETSEARLRALVDAAFEGIGIAYQGVVVDANEQLAAMYGTTRDGLIGRPVASLAAPESEALVRSRVEQRLEGAYEHIAQRLDGSTFPAEVRARTVGVGGRTLRISAIRDMTDRKHVEIERERMIRELTARNAEMEQFTYTVSHDLKSPLVTINGFLGALERDLRDGDHERVQSDLNRIRSASAKMSALLDNLLELSRVGRIGGVFQPVSLNTVAREAEELLAGFLLERKVQLTIAPDLPVVRGDRGRLVQVLQNLFENAAKYMGSQPQPQIELGAHVQGEDCVCFVRDNGIGIEPRYAERIFGLFEKLDPRSAGTGIGLALVRRIIEFHGGRVWVESDGHNGSTFLFRLPRATRATTPPQQGTTKP
jgi:PAS domain S-box-containing protein